LKALFAVFLFVLSSLSFSVVLAEIQPLEQKVSVYNWSEYIPEGVLEEFTKETGIKVDYTTFDSNEVMYTRLKIFKGRGYDVVVPSTYLVSRMRREGLIQPLQHKWLKNFKHLNPDLMNRDFDPKNAYSIPYLWGSTGIGINSSKIPNQAPKSWLDLWSTDYRNSLLLTDDMREVFHMALKVNGHSTNTSNPDEIKQAYELLKQLMPNVKLFSGEPRPEFVNGNVNIGLMWSGEMAIAKQENPVFDYIYPEEGPTLWIDNFAIPSRAKNVANAHVFIDFMLRPDIAARSSVELGYATPNMAGKKLLDKGLKENPIIFPPSEVLLNAEFQRDVGTAHKTYQLYWNKLKTLLQTQ
jgi:spermidine/putrescine transport system substrate-binding protein